MWLLSRSQKGTSQLNILISAHTLICSLITCHLLQKFVSLSTKNTTVDLTNDELNNKYQLSPVLFMHFHSLPENT